MPDAIFDGWENIGRILIVTPLIYAAVVIMTRLSGKRSTSQMNNFDWIVTVAIGSLVGSAILSRSIPFAEAFLAIALLFLLQFALTWTSFRSARLEGLIKANPRMLVCQGRFLTSAMREERVTRDEVLGAVREAGHRRLDAVRYVILETDARFSVIAESGEDDDRLLFERFERAAR